MTPHHRKPHQEIPVLHPKSFPKQRNSLSGQIAKVLTAKFKKSTWRNSPKKQRGLGRDQRADAGGCLGFLSPGEVVQQGQCAGRASTSGGFQPKPLLPRPVMERLGLSGRSRAPAGGHSSSSTGCVSACQFSGGSFGGGFYCPLQSLTAFPAPPPPGGLGCGRAGLTHLVPHGGSMSFLGPQLWVSSSRHPAHVGALPESP